MHEFAHMSNLTLMTYYVVELDDPNEFPTPTWGPFDTAAFAQGWVEERLVSDYVTTDDYVSGDVIRSIETGDGIFYHIKQLTSPY